MFDDSLISVHNDELLAVEKMTKLIAFNCKVFGNMCATKYTSRNETDDVRLVPFNYKWNEITMKGIGLVEVKILKTLKVYFVLKNCGRFNIT